MRATDRAIRPRSGGRHLALSSSVPARSAPYTRSTNASKTKCATCASLNLPLDVPRTTSSPCGERFERCTTPGYRFSCQRARYNFTVASSPAYTAVWRRDQRANVLATAARRSDEARRRRIPRVEARQCVPDARAMRCSVRSVPSRSISRMRGRSLSAAIRRSFSPTGGRPRRSHISSTRRDHDPELPADRFHLVPRQRHDQALPV